LEEEENKMPGMICRTQPPCFSPCNVQVMELSGLPAFRIREAFEDLLRNAQKMENDTRDVGIGSPRPHSAPSLPHSETPT
jgi:hypothetical protein